MNLRLDPLTLACALGLLTACGSTQPDNTTPEILPNVDPVGTGDSKQPKELEPEKADPTTGAGAANGEERGGTSTGAGAGSEGPSPPK